ncbi:phosphoglycerate mutase family protein [Nocardia sp. NPDC051981]|uniref:phosphoglycerate mutase family protein n=1 Tax=Nocardia sp. NPDC051981 TaxID=3155417 RepID=UPI003422E240
MTRTGHTTATDETATPTRDFSAEQYLHQHENIEGVQVVIAEPLNPLGMRSAEKIGGLPGRASVVHGRAGRAQQTADFFGVSGDAAAALRDLDCGDWTGQSMQALDPDRLMGGSPIRPTAPTAVNRSPTCSTVSAPG